MKRALRASELSIGELLSVPPEFLLTARFADLLLAVPGYGEVRIARLLKGCGVFSLKTVGGLSERQRAQIAAVLADSGTRSSAATRGASGVSVGPV